MTPDPATIARRTAKAAVLPLGLGRPRRPGDLVMLLYHRLGEVRREVWMPPREFEQQLAELAGRERLLSAEEALADGVRGGLLVTFDDGYADFHEHALPVLERYRVPALLYLATGLVGEGRSARGERRGMSWTQVREAFDSGLITLGAHTHDHVDLSRVPAGTARDQVARSKTLIEDRLGVPCRHFAYPFAVASPQAERIVRDLFDTAARDAWRTNRSGAIDPHALGRIPVLRSDGRFFFRAKVAGRLNGEALVYRAFKRGPWRRVT